MRVFLSAGEPSGDLHGANLAQALRELEPNVVCTGFGGERMAAAGCDLLYPLCQHAVMGFFRVVSQLGFYRQLLRQADEAFRTTRPDVLVLIDYPGFHWWLARAARRHGIPVVYFVPPQLWAWAGWRVRKMRRLVDRVLCNLPFEERWYHQRGVAAEYVGHPYFDELAHQQFDDAFLREQLAADGPIVAILPGSRDQELDRNLALQLDAAARVHAARPDVRFLAACYAERHRKRVATALAERRLPGTAHVGRTPEIIHLAHCCVSVSGSVSLELLWHGKPSVIVYRVRPFQAWSARKLLAVRYITLVDLLADRELFPEFLTGYDDGSGVARHLLRWLNDRPTYDTLCRELADLRQAVGEPGACLRAARVILAEAGQRAETTPMENPATTARVVVK